MTSSVQRPSRATIGGCHDIVSTASTKPGDDRRLS
jgi:hypothetical protein